MRHKFLRDKDFYKALFTISIPIIIQNFISSSLNFVDNVMIGRLGETAIASVGYANQIFFLFMLVVFGGYSGASIFLSQYWGQKDVKNIKRVLGMMIIFGLIVSILFTVASIAFPKQIIDLFSNDAEAIQMGSDYLRIIAFGFIFSGFSFAYGFSSRSIRKTKLPMVVSAISLIVNTGLNALLIYGLFGFPRLEVKGAAIATLIARILECLLMVWFIYKDKNHELRASFNELFDWGKDQFVKVGKKALPVLLNEGTWALGTVIYFVFYGKVGTEAAAAVQISNTIMNFFTIVFMGLSNASAVMIGNKIGEGDMEEALEYSREFLVIAFIMAVTMGLSLYLLSPHILKLFKLNETGYVSARLVLIVTSVFMIPKMFNWIMVVGVLRSGGDTVFTLMMDLGGVWGIGIPLAWLSSVYFKYPIHIVVAFVYFEEIVKMIISIPRYLSKKWINRVID